MSVEASVIGKQSSKEKFVSVLRALGRTIDAISKDTIPPIADKIGLMDALQMQINDAYTIARMNGHIMIYFPGELRLARYHVWTYLDQLGMPLSKDNIVKHSVKDDLHKLSLSHPKGRYSAEIDMPLRAPNIPMGIRVEIAY